MKLLEPTCILLQSLTDGSTSDGVLSDLFRESVNALRKEDDRIKREFHLIESLFEIFGSSRGEKEGENVG